MQSLPKCMFLYFCNYYNSLISFFKHSLFLSCILRQQTLSSVQLPRTKATGLRSRTRSLQFRPAELFTKVSTRLEKFMTTAEIFSVSPPEISQKASYIASEADTRLSIQLIHTQTSSLTSLTSNFEAQYGAYLINVHVKIYSC